MTTRPSAARSVLILKADALFSCYVGHSLDFAREQYVIGGPAYPKKPVEALMRTHPLRPSQRLLRVYGAMLILAMTAYVLSPDPKEETTPWFIALSMALFILASFFWYYRVGVRIKQQALNSTLALPASETTHISYIYARFALQGAY